MIDTAGVRFKRNGKIYFFDINETGAKIGDSVIVETIRGIEMGYVASKKAISEDEDFAKNLKPIIRIATEEDRTKQIDNRNNAKEAAIICTQKIKDHKLDMRLVGTEYTFDKSKLLFYFIADERIDFRELVRDLAAIFKTRIELRQIGVRDQAKIVGALGCCGRETCCSKFLTDFAPVSIKMAKDQGLSLNPTKISGSCGRLMCCLKYEQEGYECILKRMPQVGECVETKDGKGVVVETYTIQELVKVKFKEDDDEELQIYDIKDIKRTKRCGRFNRENEKDKTAKDEDYFESEDPEQGLTDEENFEDL